MTKQEKLNAIYEAMADKTLSYGCTVKTSDWRVRFIWNAGANVDIVYFGWCWCCEESDEVWDYTIIWHPVRIGDVLDYWDTIAYLYPERTEYTILYKWGNKRLPIDEQSDECIDYVYSLISK